MKPNNKYNKDKPYKITFYDNGNAKIDYHVYEPFKDGQLHHIPTRTHNEEPFMTIKQYKSTLKRKRKEFHSYDLNAENCLFLTLTFAEQVLWFEMDKYFQVFIRNVKRNFIGTKYIRAFEPYENGKNYHIHILLIFNNNVPTNINKNWIAKHWKHGYFDIQPTWDPYGVIENMKLYKENAINTLHKPYTYYPEWISILSASRGIPKLKVSRTQQVNKEELDQIRTEFRENRMNKWQKFHIYLDCHTYIDRLTGEVINCRDKEFWH